MNCIFQSSPVFSTENWLYHIPETADAQIFMNFYRKPMNKNQAEWLIRNCTAAFRQKKELILGAYLKKDMRLKCIFEIYHVGENTCTIGYRCCFAEQNHGYVTDSLYGILQFLGNNGIKRIEASTSVKNIASQHVLMKNGFTCMKKAEGNKLYLYTI